MKVIYHKRRGIYMKALKKAAVALLAVCLMVPMFSFAVFAADGRLMFSDPETKVGENVSVDLVVQSPGNTIADVSVTMRYETGNLEFVSGDGFEADGSGTLTYSGTGNSSELRATVQFRALTADKIQQHRRARRCKTRCGKEKVCGQGKSRERQSGWTQIRSAGHSRSRGCRYAKAP